jgi:hypothetical protein
VDRCGSASPGDLGYEGEDVFVLPVKKPAGGQLTDAQRQHNWLHAYARAQAERANSLLKTTFKALRRISLSPGTIGKIVAAALVLLHAEHDRTT